MDEDDHDDQRSTKSDIITGSSACFLNKGNRQFLDVSNSAVTPARSFITTRLHSIGILSHGNALIHKNMDQSFLSLDNSYNNTAPYDLTAISPCLKIATVPRQPFFHNHFSPKNTPDIDYAYSCHEFRSDIQHLSCIFQGLYRLIQSIKSYPNTRSLFLSDVMMFYLNDSLSVNEDVFQFPNLWIPLETLDLSKYIKCIPVLDDDLDIQQVVMRPSILHELLFAMLVTLICAMTPPGLQGHDTSVGGFSIVSSPYLIKPHFLDASYIGSGHGGGSSGNKFKDQGTLFSSYCSQVLETLVILCSASQWSWYGFGGQTCRIERWSLPSFLQLVLGTVDPWMLECKRRTLSFFTVADAPSEGVCGRKDKLCGDDGGRAFTNLSKILRSNTSIPYIVERQARPDRKKCLGPTQDTWSQSQGDVILKALKSFDGDRDVGDIAVDTLLELLKTGQGKWKHDKRLAKHALGLIKKFAHTMVSAQSNGDFQPQILQFMHSIQQQVGGTSTDRSINDKYIDKATQTLASLEEKNGLRRTVDQLRNALHASEETITRMRRERNDLEMKVKDCDNKPSAIQQLEHQKEPPTIAQQQNYQRPMTGSVDSVISQVPCLSSIIPTPPPPPPPNFDSFSIGRKFRPRSTSKSSTYFHPLALNLNFASLKSLHENTPTSPTSPTSNDTSTSQASCHQQIAPHHAHLRQTPKITMKQFFWSKLPRERIQNTVWKEISCDEATMATNKNHRQATIQPSRKQHYQHLDNKLVELDIAVLEKLFKKTQGIKMQTTGQHQGLQAITKLRKPPLTTLLEFNRANNIAIMLARIKLTYPEICDSILKIDDRLNMDNLTAIRQYIPTKEEIETIQDYNGDGDTLGNSEKYFKAIMYIPRLADRIDCMIFQRKFHHEIQELSPELNILQSAIDELRHSHQFKLILKTILAIGNYLNDHTIRGNAYGFHLDALLKMGDTKAEDKGDINLPTLLHYLVFFLSKTGKQKVVTFKDDIPHLESAAQISPPTLFASVKSLDGNLDHIRNELAIHQQRPILQKMDRFTELMTSFLEEAEPIVENVKNLAKDIQERLKDLIMYYGEDPTLVKPQDFFSVICTFSSSFEKAKIDIEQARQKALRQQQDTIKKVSKDSLASSTVATIAPKLHGNLARTSLRVVSTGIQDGSPKKEGFGQVLQELRAGLKRGDHSWRVESSTRRKSVSHCDGAPAVLF